MDKVLTKIPTMVHWNNEPLICVNIRTSGPCSWWHEILRLTILPVDSNLNLYKKKLPFDVFIKPNYPERFNKQGNRSTTKLMTKCLSSGLTSDDAIDLLLNWLEKLGHQQGGFTQKKCTILCFDSTIITPFLQYFLNGGGFISDEEPLFHTCFNGKVIDVRSICIANNDALGLKSEPMPMQKPILAYCAKANGITYEKTPLGEAFAIIELYRKLTNTSNLF